MVEERSSSQTAHVAGSQGSVGQASGPSAVGAAEPPRAPAPVLHKAHARAPKAQPSGPAPPLKAEVKSLNFYYGQFHAIKNVSLGIVENGVTAIIGPSGCGKSTLLRCFNRMHDLYRDSRYEGEILLQPSGRNIVARDVDPIEMRMRIGMVFQKPNPFPKSIFDNVAYGLRLKGIKHAAEIHERVTAALEHAALWDEVKDRLRSPAYSLSGGQQQRLCIARALATEPEIMLFDEPTSALDPMATSRIEDLIDIIKDRITVIIVTHNMQQASRVSDYTAFMYLGELIEVGPTRAIFSKPSHKFTNDYITGRFG